MKKATMSFLLVLIVMALFIVIAEPAGPYDAYAEVITDLLDDLGPIVLTVIGAALGIAGGILVVRIGFRWVKKFVSGG